MDLQRRLHELLVLTQESSTLVPSLPPHLDVKGPVHERAMTRKAVVWGSPLWAVRKLNHMPYMIGEGYISCPSSNELASFPFGEQTGEAHRRQVRRIVLAQGPLLLRVINPRGSVLFAPDPRDAFQRLPDQLLLRLLAQTIRSNERVPRRSRWTGPSAGGVDRVLDVVVVCRIGCTYSTIGSSLSGARVSHVVTACIVITVVVVLIFDGKKTSHLLDLERTIALQGLRRSRSIRTPA